MYFWGQYFSTWKHVNCGKILHIFLHHTQTHAICGEFQISPHLSCGDIWNFSTCGEIFTCHTWKAEISPHDYYPFIMITSTTSFSTTISSCLIGATVLCTKYVLNVLNVLNMYVRAPENCFIYFYFNLLSSPEVSSKCSKLLKWSFSIGSPAMNAGSHESRRQDGFFVFADVTSFDQPTLCTRARLSSQFSKDTSTSILHH